MNIPIGAVAALLLFLVKIPEDPAKKDRKSSSILSLLYELDVIGFVFFAGFAVQLLLALEWGGNLFAWNSSTIIGLFVGAGLTGIVFAAWEYHVGDIAMIPLSLLRQTVVWSSCLVSFFFFACAMMPPYYMPIYFQAVKGVSPSLSGVYLLPQILSQILFAVGGGVLSKSHSWFITHLTG
jgi:hypothetical protein